MINTHLKFEANIPNGSKVVALTKNYTKFPSFMTNLTWKVKVKVTSSQTLPRLLMNSLSSKVKFEVV